MQLEVPRQGNSGVLRMQKASSACREHSVTVTVQCMCLLFFYCPLLWHSVNLLKTGNRCGPHRATTSLVL